MISSSCSSADLSFPLAIVWSNLRTLARVSKDNRRETPLEIVSPTDCQNSTASLVKPHASNLAAIWTRIRLEREKLMKSPVIKRSIVIAGHKTSVSLEDAFWQGLKDIATARDMTLSELV